MKRITLICCLLFCCLALTAQDPIKVNLAKQINASDISVVKLYKFNSNNQCNQSKAVSIIYENKLSACFDYVKTISPSRVKKIIKLIRTVSTYGSEDVACFDTDYSLVLFNKTKVVVGYINISLSCNKLIANPVIPEREYHIKDGWRNVGFSKNGRKCLIKLLTL